MPPAKTNQNPTTKKAISKRNSASKSGPVPKKAAKKPAFSKEVIPFQWKIVGNSSGLIVVLSKHTEREATEKELTRLQEGKLYKSLRIEPIDAVIVQPVRKRRKSAKKTAKTAKAKKKAASKKITPEKSAAMTKAKSKTKAAKKSAKKVAPKPKAVKKGAPKPKPKAKAKSKAKPRAASKSKKK